MVIEDIRIRHIDASETISDLFYKNRILDVYTNKGKIMTPNRFTTNSEITARSQIPLSSPVPTDCCILFKPLTWPFMNNFHTNTSAKCAQLLRLNTQFNDLTKRSILRLSIFQPAKTALENMSIESKIRFAEMQAQYLQFMLNADIITYPYLDLPTSSYIDFINRNNRRNEHVSTVFTLDMGMDENSFKKILDHLIAPREPTLLALIHRDLKNNIGQYNYLASKYKEEKVAFIACQVPREDIYTKLSMAHEIIHHSFDFVALEQRHGGGPLTPDLNKIRIFSPQQKSLDTLANTLADNNRSIIDELRIPEYNFRDTQLVHRMIEGYRGAGRATIKFQKWFYLARLHEIVNSKIEFSHVQEAIRTRNVAEYILESALTRSTHIKTFR